MNRNSSMLKQFKEELENLKKDLPRLKAIADEAEEKFSNSRQGRPVYPRDQIGPYSNAKARIDALSQEIPSLQKLVNWEEGVEFASKNLRIAKRDMAKVQGEIKVLQDRREKLESKRASLVAKHEEEFEAAEHEEQEAAQAYAQAIAEDDSGIERKAEGLLQKASHALAIMKQALKGAKTVASALSVQITELDECIENKKAELEALRTNILQSARFYWSDRFESLTRELVNLAAHVSASEDLLGYGDSLTKLYIPNLSPRVNECISNREVKTRRESIRLEQLTDV